MPREEEGVSPIQTVLRIADNCCAQGCVVINVTANPGLPISPSELAEWAKLTELNAIIVDSGVVIAHANESGAAVVERDVCTGLSAASRAVSGTRVDAFHGWMALPPCRTADVLVVHGPALLGRRGDGSLRAVLMSWSDEALYAGSFQGCGNLAVVTLSDNLDEVEACCFDRCGGLRQGTLLGHTRVGKEAFHLCRSPEDTGHPRKLMLCSQSMHMTGVEEFGSGIRLPRIGKEALHASRVREIRGDVDPWDSGQGCDWELPRPVRGVVQTGHRPCGRRLHRAATRDSLVRGRPHPGFPGPVTSLRGGVQYGATGRRPSVVFAGHCRFLDGRDLLCISVTGPPSLRELGFTGMLRLGSVVQPPPESESFA